MINIIDIGSNSVRLLSNGKKTVITTRLAENMSDGLLDSVSVNRTVAAIKSLCDVADGSCIAFATAAVRNAKNQSEFSEKVFSSCGIKVDVIDGAQEAEIGYMGATLGYTGKAAVIDLGGASCEIVFGECGKILYKNSFHFGCVTMKDKFGGDLDGINKYVTELLGSLPNYTADKYLAVGGTATALAAMAQNLPVYDPSKVDGYMLDADTIDTLISETLNGKDYPTLSPERRKTIVQGAAALRAVLLRLDSSVTVSEKDNLEGYAIKHNLM